MTVIPNGVAIDRFIVDRHLGQRMRHAWSVSDDVPLIGLVARLDPMKDHINFLNAATVLSSRMPHVRYVIAGNGPEWYRQTLLTTSERLGIGSRLIWTGEVTDVVSVNNALDVATSTSAFGEGFSNSVSEAMACGVPCVVTDVGDSSFLVGMTGLVVPTGDPESLAAAWQTLLEMPKGERVALGNSARQRIVDEFSSEALARRTETALTGLLDKTD